MDNKQTIAIVILSIALAVTGFFLWLENQKRKALQNWNIAKQIQKRINEINNLLANPIAKVNIECLQQELVSLNAILDSYKDVNETTIGKQACPKCATTSGSVSEGGGQLTGFTQSGYWNIKCCPVSGL